MGFGEHIGIDAQREARFALQFASPGSEQFQFRLAFHVEFEDARFQPAIDLHFGLAYSRKHNAIHRLRRGGDHPLQFSAGDDVEPRSVLQPEA